LVYIKIKDLVGLNKKQNDLLNYLYEYDNTVLKEKFKYIDKLVELNLICFSDKFECELTEKGRKVMYKYLNKKNWIPLYMIGEILTSIRISRQCTIEQISESLSLSKRVIGNLEIMHGTTIYIDDLEKLVNFYDLELDDVVMNNSMKYLDIIKKCDSPIEKLFIKEFMLLKEYFSQVTGTNIKILPQQKYKVNESEYRVDFQVIISKDNNILHKFLIECDGHDFHEKTKEQAKRDKQRDRDFLSLGIKTIRFTGSEIYNNATKCVVDVFKTVYQDYRLFDLDIA
jgi:very-short-patch-repair endonuclease